MKIISLVVMTVILTSCCEEKSNIQELETAYNNGFRDGNQKAASESETKFETKYNKLRAESEKEIKELRSALIQSRIHISSTNLYSKDSLSNYLFSIRYFDGNDRVKDRKNLSIVNKYLDTSYVFSGPINYSPSYQEVQPFLIKTGILKGHRNGPKIRNGFFSFHQAITIDNENMLGVFIEFFGFERICYAYAKMSINDNKYHIGEIYNNLDVTSIGSFTYDSVYSLSNNEFYIIAQNIGEEYHGIALHYFPADFNNKIYLLEQCFPNYGAGPRDEKIEFDYNYDNQTIKIDKFDIDIKSKEGWKVVSSKEFLLHDLIEELKSTNYYQLPRKRN